MDSILKNTHRSDNIKLLKVRDYYFDKARRLNKVRLVLIFIPPVILLISYIIPILGYLTWIDDYRDIAIGLLSIILFFVIHFSVKKRIDDFLYISNAFREEYDCKVFGLQKNIFAYSLKEKHKNLEKARYVPDNGKYEVWYGEIFCNNRERNVLCCQLDNIVYTHCVYQKYKRFLITLFVCLSVVFLGGVSVGAVFSLKNASTSISQLAYTARQLASGILALFNIAQMLIEDVTNITVSIRANSDITTLIKEKQKEIGEQLDRGDDTILRMLQDVIIFNRNNSVFISRRIRNRYLKEGCEFYKRLNEYKAMFWNDRNPQMPSSAENIDIFDLNEKNTVTLADVHERLLYMMTKVAEAFEKENITYTLDGGSLIGAVRNETVRPPEGQLDLKNGKFIFWDDDIDIAIPAENGMVERAKAAITQHLSNEFDIQDYNNDQFYSPRLSNFRIRDKYSITTEKDSELYDRYAFRGLFIDVYAYTPIMHNILIDSLYRRVRIHTLYKMLRRTEADYNKYKLSGESEDKKRLGKLLKKFSAQKAEYLSRVDWYLVHAKNKKYYAYTPNYIHSLKKAGPYIKASEMYPTKQKAQFETLQLPIPADPAAVLKKYYNDWYSSPFKLKDQLIQEYGNEWFSAHTFRVTEMKHIDHAGLNIRQEICNHKI